MTIYTGIDNTMMDAATRRTMLGTFIRTHRERLTPPTLARGRRRTPGWRREELAEAAGIGVTWLTWLEQGREVDASAAVCGRLATALRLNAAERAALFELAGRRDPDLSALHTRVLPEALLALPDRISVPAYVLDHSWTARAWNRLAADLFVGWLDADAHERNLLRYVFLTDQARTFIVNWEARAARLVAEFRADFNHHIGDLELQRQIADLALRSPKFATCWRAQSIVEREGGERSFLHPRLGLLHYWQTTLLAAADQTLKLVCLSKLD